MKAFATRALDRRALEPALEGGGVHAGQPVEGGVDELWAREHAFDFVSRRSLTIGFLRDRFLRGSFVDGGFFIRPFVPWADVLANVAAEDLAADRGAEVFGDCAFLFYGEVGDAARGVHLARGDKGVGGAGVDAAGTGAAAIGSGRKCGGGRNGDGRDDHAEEEPGAELLVHDARVLADPTDAGAGGEGSFDDGAGVDVAAGLAIEALVECSFNLMKADEELIVVVGWRQIICWFRVCAFGGAAAPGIASDPTGVGWRGIGGEWGGGVVVEGADDDGSRPRNDALDGTTEKGALFVPPLEVFHLAGAASGDPCGETLGVELGRFGGGCRIDRGDPCGVESGVDGQLAEPEVMFGDPFGSRHDAVPLGLAAPML